MQVLNILKENQEKCLLLAAPELGNDHRSIRLKAKLVLRERGLVVFGQQSQRGGGVEGLVLEDVGIVQRRIGVHECALQILISGSVKRFGAGLQGHIDHSGGSTAVRGIHRTGGDLELLQGIRRRRHGVVLRARLADVGHAVDAELDAGAVDGKCLCALVTRSYAIGCGHQARGVYGEVECVVIEIRKLLKQLVLHHVADVGFGVVENVR